MRLCHGCRKEISLDGRVGRGDICPHCGAHLRCCLNCKFYDAFAHNRCKEPDAEWTPDKEGGNFCEFFSFRDIESASEDSDKARKAKEKLRRLFKD